MVKSAHAKSSKVASSAKSPRRTLRFFFAHLRERFPSAITHVVGIVDGWP